MSYKTLMVHLEIGRSNAGLLQIAATLADRFGASVIGIAGCLPPTVVYGDGYVVGSVIEYDLIEIDKALKAVEMEFRGALAQRVTDIEWRCTSQFNVLTDYIICEARSADLVITAAATEDFFDASRAVNISDFVMRLGRPVLIVPAAVTQLNLDRVVLAWNDTRESRRAAADALPILKQAANVYVVQLAGRDDMAEALMQLADVLAWLKRQGINAKSFALPTTGDDATGLSAFAQEQSIDVIVAGAYGHSRLREWALGGVTRDLLLRTNRCSLVSH